MSWRLANSLAKLRAQVNAHWPTRGKDSDGSIGDEHHSARTSDHNPDDLGIVRAIDITHDPLHGFDSYKFAELLLAKQDPRLKYVISNRRIGSGPAGPEPGVWRKYTGTNPHDHHCHISVMPKKPGGQDPGEDAREWDISSAAVANPVSAARPPAQFKAPPPTLRPGASNETVAKMQKALGVKVTGKYEPQSETEWALRLLQVRNGLTPDGVAGPQTWKVIDPDGKLA